MALVRSFGNTNFDHLSESDLNNLVTVGVPEGVFIEYKREPYGAADADVKEFLKDCSSFANTAGGHLIIGIEEAEGIASRLIPIATKDVDRELQRLESLCRDGVDPRIVALRMKAIPLNDGGAVIVLKIPRSWNPPHRVTARNTNRFYARNSAGAYEVSLEELRALFTKSASTTDRIRNIRDQRLMQIDNGRGTIPLAPERSRLLLHLVPLTALMDDNLVDLEKAHALQQSLHPLGQQSFTSQFNFDGFATFRGGSVCFGYTQIFRSGIIEATYAGIAREREGRWVIPSMDFDRNILEVVPKYMSALQSLEIPPPVVMMLTLQGVEGAILGVRDDWGDPPQPITRDTLTLPEVVFESYGAEEDYQSVMRPAFDALWNAAGYIRSQYFNAEGQ